VQTRSYESLFNLVKSLAGVNDFTTEEDSYILNFTNRRFKQAYDAYPFWARYLVASEQRSALFVDVTGHSESGVNQKYVFVGNDAQGGGVYQGETDGSYTLSRQPYSYTPQAWVIGKGNVVTIINGVVILTIGSSGLSLKAQESPAPPTPNLSPTPNPWECSYTNNVIVTLLPEAIPFVSRGKTNIGEFLRIHRNNAFDRNSTLEYDFYVTENGASLLNVQGGSSNFVYVTYKKEVPFITTTTDLIPLEFFYFIAHAVYADFLRMDGQNEKAIAEEQIAEQYLDDELGKASIIANTNIVGKKISTYVNRQSR